LKNRLVKTIKIVLFYPGFCLLLCALPFFNPFLKIFSLSFSLASGESMYPTIKDGDLIVSRPYEIGKDELRKGMIIRLWDTYGDEVVNIQHRIIEVSKEGVETQGDNNETPDEGVKKYSQIYSISRSVIPSHQLGVGKIKELPLFFSESLKERILGLPVSRYLIFFLLMEVCLLVIRRKIQGTEKTG
jgi:signal peptidase I